MVHAIGGQQPRRILLQHRDLVGLRHPERVDLVVGHPLHVGVDRFVGQLDALTVQAAQPAGHSHGPARGLGGGRRIELHMRGESPGAVDNHPHRQTDGAPGDGRLHLLVAQHQLLVDQPMDAQVRITGTGGAGRVQGGVGELGAGQRQEIGIY
ncbi:Uncharacterised protein [Mycobacteroides abscessus subsp. abscessus]|nr:Uncharacterised protein [Mycobacteroides abscessus subsp. abscessus]